MMYLAKKHMALLAFMAVGGVDAIQMEQNLNQNNGSPNNTNPVNGNQGGRVRLLESPLQNEQHFQDPVDDMAIRPEKKKIENPEEEDDWF